MSEGAGEASGTATTSPSAGALLRRAREASGLHIGALSVALKVPVAKLEALESDRLDLLPDAVFARALASSVCRTLKIDPAPILERLPEHVRPQLQLESRTTDRTSLHAPRRLGRDPVLSRISRPVAVVAGLLVLGALALLLQPTLSGRVAKPEPAGNDAPAAVLPPAVASPASAMAVASGVLAAAASAAAPVLAGAASAMVATLPVPAPAAEPAAPAVPAAAGSQAAGASDGATVLFKARGASWIEVTDSRGTVQLRRNLRAGESVPVAGTLPLAVVVGRADAIDVQVRGQPLDLAPLARDNVARFQVK